MKASLTFHDFAFLKKSGRRFKGRCFIVLHDNSQNQFSWAAIASKRVGNAVTRNYHKRCLREIMATFVKEHHILGYQLMIICLPNLSVSFKDRKKELEYIFTKIGAINKTKI